MTYSDQFNIRSRFVKFNDVADAIDGLITRQNAPNTSGSSTAYSITPLPTWSSIPTGAMVVFVPHLTNGSNATLTVNNIGPSPLLRGGVAIAAGSMLSGVPYLCLFNGVGWEVLSSTELPASRLLPLTLDQVNNRVGINKTNPNAGLQVYSNASYSGEANVSSIFGISDVHAGIILGVLNGNAPYIAAGKMADGSGVFTSLRLRTSNLDRLVIAEDGAITIGGQVNAGAFSAPIHYANVYYSERAAATPYNEAGFYTRVDGTIYGGMYLDDTDTKLRIYSANNIDFYPFGNFRCDMGTDGLGINGGLYLRQASQADSVPVNYISLKNSNAVDNAIKSITFDNYAGVGAAIVCRQNSLSNFNTELSFATSQGGYAERFAIRDAKKIFSNGQLVILATAIAQYGGATMTWNGTTGEVGFVASSRLIKENIVECPYGLQTVTSLKPRYFYNTGTKQQEVGFVADEVLPLVPEVVIFGNKSAFTQLEEDVEEIPISLQYEKITAILCKAIQELNQKVEELKARLDNL